MSEQPGDALAEQIATQQVQRGRATAFDLVNSMEAEFAKALPKEVPVEAFMRTALTELKQSTALQQCSAESLLGAFLTAARLGLEVGGPLGHFYLTPRTIKGTPSVVPIVGYQGLLELARRSGRVGAIKAFLVYEGDLFREGANSERGPFFDYEPMPGKPKGRPITGVLAAARLAGGDVQHHYMTLDEVMDRKARGAAGDSGPWKTDRDAMILKTALRALTRQLPQSTRLTLATRVDEQVQTYIPGQTLDTGTGELTP
jgi:recombination protein RecT